MSKQRIGLDKALSHAVTTFQNGNVDIQEKCIQTPPYHHTIGTIMRLKPIIHPPIRHPPNFQHFRFPSVHTNLLLKQLQGLLSCSFYCHRHPIVQPKIEV